MAKSTLHSENSEFYGWASSASVVNDQPLQVSPKYVETLLNLPRYKNVDITDLFEMAEKELTYTKSFSARLRAGQALKGIKIVDRAFAIAILIGYTKLDDPILQVPMVGVEPVVMPRFANS